MSKPANRHKSGFRGPSPDVGKDTQFRPGQSGNPSGRPKSRLISEAYRRILEEIDPKKQQSLAERVARAVINRALRGDVRAASEVADRTEGKAVQKMEVDTHLKQLRELSDTELAAAIQARLEELRG